MYFKVNYHEVETFTGEDSNTVWTNTVLTDFTQIVLESLLPGRNYSISVIIIFTVFLILSKQIQFNNLITFNRYKLFLTRWNLMKLQCSSQHDLHLRLLKIYDQFPTVLI